MNNNNTKPVLEDFIELLIIIKTVQTSFWSQLLHAHFNKY